MKLFLSCLWFIKIHRSILIRKLIDSPSSGQSGANTLRTTSIPANKKGRRVQALSTCCVESPASIGNATCARWLVNRGFRAYLPAQLHAAPLRCCLEARNPTPSGWPCSSGGDPAGNLRSADSWEDTMSWQHSRSTRGALRICEHGEDGAQDLRVGRERIQNR
jgi:hypothetical protein